MSRIAVIGSGIAGMSAAYLLSRKHTVWLFERDERIGGHTHTHLIETRNGVKPIDTGFIVHNDLTYPNFIRLLKELRVSRQKSDMSFGVQCPATGFEYSSRGLRGFFAQRGNLLRPAHYRLLTEILRFNKISSQFLASGQHIELTLGEYMAARNFSRDMAKLYLYPMASAVWSASMDEIEHFPALTLLRFFFNHGFLTVNQHPQWYAIEGGSSRYIAPLTATYRERIKTSAGVSKVVSLPEGVEVIFDDGKSESFDDVVFACHGPQSLKLLHEPTEQEREVLSAFKTTANSAILHTDSRLLPKRADARASWNYAVGPQSTVTVTYHMNRLQNLETVEDYCVTLNGDTEIDRSKILRKMEYQHPLYTLDADRSQKRWAEISGIRHLHWCGAYWFYGFHEDGLNSAIRVAAQLGVDW